MNIIQAAKSGKRFKRKEWIETGWLSFNGNLILRDGDNDVPHLEKEDLTCDDWEIEEEKIEISRNEFFDAVKKILEEKMAEKRLVYEPESRFNQTVFESVCHYWKELKKRSDKD